MRKLVILVMAMVLVCGLSLGVMGYEEGNLESGDVTDDIGVNLTVQEYAVLDIENPNTPFELIASEPYDTEQHNATSVANDSKAITIRANTDDIKVTVRENLSRNVANSGNIDDEYISSLGGNTYGASFGAFLDTSENNVTEGDIDESERNVWTENDVAQGREFVYNTSDTGFDWTDNSFDGYLNVNMVWANEFEHITAADDYSGTVEVIIAAN